MTVLGHFGENVALAADVAGERHHDLFANRVNGRIRDLREELLEVVEQRLRPVRKTREGRVCPHRAHRLLAFRSHGAKDHAQVFIAVAERALPAKQGFRIGVVHARGRRQLIDGDLIVFEPLRIGLPRSKPVFDLFVGDDAALDCIHQKHLPRLQAAFHLYLLRFDVEHSGFRSHDDEIVIRDHVPSGAQAVAVEDRADDPSIGKRDGRRPVPRFHQARVIFIKRALVRLHVRIASPRFRYQHGHRVRKAAPRLQQKFHRVIEICGVAAIGRNDGIELLQVVAKQRRLQNRLARVHPVDVALKRVDLAIVRDVAVGMRSLPTRKCVGGEALMHQAQRAGYVGIGKLFVEIRDLRSEQETLVNNSAARK